MRGHAGRDKGGVCWEDTGHFDLWEGLLLIPQGAQNVNQFRHFG